MSNPKISYSAWGKYMQCPKMFDYHYNQRLRPCGTSSALLFGVAVDAGLNSLLTTKNLETALSAFRDAFKFEDMQNTQWDYKDFDPRLLDQTDITKNSSENAWRSMRVKGRMLIEAYNDEVVPLIEEVEIVQKELSNRPGILDAILKLRGHGRVLIDHKTSARPYDINAVANDTQLALYAADQNITKAGFIVLIKEIDSQTKRNCLSCKFDGSHVKHKSCPNIVNGSRCHGVWNESHSPKARIQILVDNVPEINKDLISTSISEVENGIKHDVYPRNLKACGKMYGKPCPYINKCWQNDDTGLEYKEETKESK